MDQIATPDGTTPPTSRVRSISFDAASVELIAAALRVEVATAPFRLPNATVYQLLVPGENERPAAMVTLWPSIRRVDAIGPQVTAVFTDIIGVDLVEEIEVLFRRRHGEMLIVTRGGKIIVRA